MAGPSQQADEHLARAAYEAYSMQTGGKSLATRDDLPGWDALESKYRDAWVTAARAVEAAVLGAT